MLQELCLPGKGEQEKHGGLSNSEPRLGSSNHRPRIPRQPAIAQEAPPFSARWAPGGSCTLAGLAFTKAQGLGPVAHCPPRSRRGGDQLQTRGPDGWGQSILGPLAWGLQISPQYSGHSPGSCLASPEVCHLVTGDASHGCLTSSLHDCLGPYVIYF